jgi:signal transduction histidine kinase
MNNTNTFAKICWLTAALMILVLFWDHYTLKVDTTTLGYILIKGTVISSVILMGFYSHYYKKATWQQDAYGILFFIYSFYGMAHLDMTYSFSFIEAFFIIALGIKTTARRYITVNLFGLVGLIAGHYYAREPLFVAVGQSYSPHSLTVSFILFCVALMIHFLVTRQQAIIQELNEKFALVGKQSSFLMHEIKNPLNRVVANSEEGMTEQIMKDIRRDSQKISALVSSVEILIHDPKSLSRTFAIFDWSEVSENLHLDFYSYLNAMNINFHYSELQGEFYGNKSLLYQLLRNHILNAIEAIGFKKDETSEIKIKLENKGKDLILVISNTNSFIPQKDLERIFEAHFTTKKSGSNKGLGLALSKNIAEAHNGKIKATSGANETAFVLTLPNYAPNKVMV